MPAIDQCEPQVIEALGKQGWRVTHQPLQVRFNRQETVFPDLRLEREDTHEFAIVVEVKCFNRTSWLDEFYGVLGQYIYCRAMLEAVENFTPLYITVPIGVYQEFFSRQVIQTVIKSNKVKMIVIDISTAEVVEWIG